MVHPVTSSVEDGAEGGGAGSPGKLEGPIGVAAELELRNSVLVGVAVVGCEPVWGICTLMNGQDLALVPLWEETDLLTEC